MPVARQFLQSSIIKSGRHTIYTDGGTWYDEACNVLKLKNYLHSSLEKSLIEWVNQYFKDKTQSFDDYYPCMKNECNIFDVHTGNNSFYLYMMNNNNNFVFKELDYLRFKGFFCKL